MHGALRTMHAARLNSLARSALTSQAQGLLPILYVCALLDLVPIKAVGSTHQDVASPPQPTQSGGGVANLAIFSAETSNLKHSSQSPKHYGGHCRGSLFERAFGTRSLVHPLVVSNDHRRYTYTLKVAIAFIILFVK